jgi:hypothetical protein
MLGEATRLKGHLTGKLRLGAGSSSYRPKPNTVCVTRLLVLLKSGRGVFEDATPSPSAGCSTNSGAATVTTPTPMAGSKEGAAAHSRPNAASKSPAKLIPIE